MFRLLLLACFSFLFVSSSTAALLGLQQLRIVLFSLVLLSLMIAAVICFPRFQIDTMKIPLMLLAAVAWMLWMDPNPHVMDYKLALPIIVFLLAFNIRSAIHSIDITWMFWVLLTVYMIATFLLFALGSQFVSIRGTDGHLRYDLTGSIVTHASLCMLALVVGSTLAINAHGGSRIVFASVATIAALMVMLTATRTSIATLLIFALLAMIAGPARLSLTKKLIVAATIAVLIFSAYTIIVSDAFFLRLFASTGIDYSSGRFHSIVHWIGLGLEKPIFGHGIGFVREMLADGRPQIDEGRLLEWPHNEFVRFYVEGGTVGLVTIVTLVVYILAKAVRRAPSVPPEARVLTLMIAADMLAQCLLQNYFNTIYHASVLLMVFAVLTGDTTAPQKALLHLSARDRQLA